MKLKHIEIYKFYFQTCTWVAHQNSKTEELTFLQILENIGMQCPFKWEVQQKPRLVGGYRTAQKYRLANSNKKSKKNKTKN
jgi:hypothetical protein